MPVNFKMFPKKLYSLTLSYKVILLLLLFLMARGVLLVGFYYLTGGREVASDKYLFDMLVGNPWGSFAATHSWEVASYPPLLSLLIFPFYEIYSLFFLDFLSWRLVLISLELVSFSYIFMIAKEQMFHDFEPSLLIIGVVLLLSPYQFLSSIVFLQDEIIGQAFVFSFIYFMLTGRNISALMVLSLGIAAGKIFLIIPLFYYFVFSGHAWSFRSIFAAGIFVPFYAVSIFSAIINGGTVPLVEFSPTAEYSSSFWVLGIKYFDLSSDSMKSVSLYLSLVVQFIIVGLAWVFRSRFNDMSNLLLLCGGSLAAFFFTFYQHNPEYVLLFAPFILCAKPTWFLLISTSVILSLSWLPNIFYGLDNLMSFDGNYSQARKEILQSWSILNKINFDLLHTSSIIVYSISYAWMLVKLSGEFYRNKSL